GERRAARKLAPLLLAEEMEDARRDRLRGCFEATEDEIRDERERLVMCEVVCGVVSDELRRDVVFGCHALCAQETLEVRPELDGRALGTHTAFGAHEEEGVDQIDCPNCDPVAVSERYAHDAAGRPSRKRE